MSSVGLRARPATGLIDTAVVLLRRRYWDYFLAALIPALPFLIVDVFVSYRTLGWVEDADRLVWPVAAAIAACMVSGEYTGRPVSLGDALARALRRYPALIVLSLFVAVCVACGLAFLIIGAFVVAAWLYAAAPAFLLEDLSPSGAIGRSFDLANGLAPHVLGVWVGAVLANIIVDWALAALIRWGWVALVAYVVLPVRVETMLLLPAALAARPLIVVPPAVVYFDLRIRRDGFDIEAMAASLDDAAPAPSSAIPANVPDAPNAPAAGPA